MATLRGLWVLGLLAALALPARAAVDVDLGVLDQLPPKPAAREPGGANPPAAKPAPEKPKADKARRAAAPAAPLKPAAPPPVPQIEPIPPPVQAAGRTAPPAPSAEPRDVPAAASGDAVVPPPPPPEVSGGKTPPPRQQATIRPAPVEPRSAVPVASIGFAPAAAALPPSAGPDLDRLAARLGGDDRLHVQLLAYAEAGDASQSRRLSLSRALAIRSYLLDRGVRPQNIEVRPLGNRPEAGEAPDHVDLVLAER